MLSLFFMHKTKNYKKERKSVVSFVFHHKDGYKRFSKGNGVSRKGPARSLRESGALLLSLSPVERGFDSGTTPPGLIRKI
jgi:hypothetical protein